MVKQTLKNMGYSNISDVRQGKYFQIDINEKDPMKGKDLAEQICKKLLSNTVIENYKIKIEE